MQSLKAGDALCMDMSFADNKASSVIQALHP
jgi:hypothetical protein